MLKQIVTFLVAAAVLLTVTPVISAATFRDVPPDHSLYTEIEYLSSKGVINGYPDGTFKPNELMAKKHIAKMLVTALDLQKTNMKPLPYKDVPRSHIYAYLEDYDVHQYRYIVETKETYSDYVLYIAKFHGVIAYEQNGDIHRWLVERIAN